MFLQLCKRSSKVSVRLQIPVSEAEQSGMCERSACVAFRRHFCLVRVSLCGRFDDVIKPTTHVPMSSSGSSMAQLTGYFQAKITASRAFLVRIIKTKSDQNQTVYMLLKFHFLPLLPL